MSDIHLSRRLLAIAEYVPQGATLADIGTDHAYLPCHAALNGRIKKAIAGEINEGPYRSALKTVHACGLAAVIDVRKGDGLSILRPGEADAVVIAGMGGELIRRILEAGADRLNDSARLILQPNNAADKVRAWLDANGYDIVDEQILEEDGHFYEIIAADPGHPAPLSERERFFGPVLLQKQGPVFRKKWLSELEKRERVLRALEKAKRPSETEAKAMAIKKEIAEIKEVLA